MVVLGPFALKYSLQLVCLLSIDSCEQDSLGSLVWGTSNGHVLKALWCTCGECNCGVEKHPDKVTVPMIPFCQELKCKLENIVPMWSIDKTLFSSPLRWAGFHFEAIATSRKNAPSCDLEPEMTLHQCEHTRTYWPPLNGVKIVHEKLGFCLIVYWTHGRRTFSNIFPQSSTWHSFVTHFMFLSFVPALMRGLSDCQNRQKPFFLAIVWSFNWNVIQRCHHPQKRASHICELVELWIKVSDACKLPIPSHLQYCAKFQE